MMSEQEFEYLVPASIEEAIALRCRYGEDARFIAGGTEVVPLMTSGRLRQTRLIELSRLENLTAIEQHARCHHVGAAVTLSALEHSPLIKLHWPALAEAAASIREPQVRNRGTIGGNVSHGVPSADLVPPLLVFDASVGVVGPEGNRWIPLEEFLIGPYRTALRPDELVTEVKLPVPEARHGSAFLKLTKFGGFGLSVATVAAAVSSQAGRITGARLAIGSAGPVPRRVADAEEFLLGKEPTAEILARAGELAAEAADPRDGSIRASPGHRRRVLRPLAARAIARAVERSNDRDTGQTP